ncbi:MAG: XdhC family protein, partial [Aestuariivirgaceae bacterium]
GALDDGFRFDRSGVHQTPDGEAFIAIHNPALQLIIIGAVHIAQSLAPMAASAGYAVTVIDPRGAFATDERFPGVDIRAEWPDEVLPGLQLDARTAFVALTHDPKVDDPALQAALQSDCFYIGALGSKRTQASRVERLSAAGISGQDLQRIHGPIGLDLGARGAPEIAIAIMAEITGTLRQGRAGA